MALNLSYSLADQDFHHTKSLGVWNVSTQLLQHLAASPKIGRLTVFSNSKQAEVNFPANATLELHDAAASGRLGRVYWDQWGVYTAAQRSGNSWLFLPKGFAPAFRRCPVRLAAYVHDAMHLHYQRTYHPNPLENESAYFLRSLRATLRHAEIIFTNSEFTRSEVQRLAREWRLPLPRLVHAGVGFNPPKQDHPGPRRRLVVLAGPWPHKCTALAIERLSRWVKEKSFTAGVDWVGALPARVSLPEQDGWKHYTRLARHDYEQVLRRAAVVVYFSAYEGFGMPPVEATLAGAAAVYSAIPAMTEGMGGCGFPFSNESYAEFARAMNAALAAPPTLLAAWRAQLLARHSWTTVTRRIVSELAALETAALPARVRVARPAPTEPRKVLVFAHTPPPHHGQSYMVKLMLEGFGGDQRTPASPPSHHGIACYHVNARLSRDLEDVGEARLGKLVVLFGYCLAAIWCRFRHGTRVLYYVPAPGKPAALLRDWMVMALCRPFYREVVFHWHAAGLGSWLATSASPLFRSVTRRLLGRPALSIIISDFNRADAMQLGSRSIARVDYGIPDPCPDFAESLLARRRERAQRIRAALAAPKATAPPDRLTFTVLFLANCLRTKGIFDALEAFLKLRDQLRQVGSPLAVRFQVGGAFGDVTDQRLFETRITEAGAAADVDYLGFVSGPQKDAALRSADVLCFPTYYPGENQPIVLIESLAYGLPAVTTQWRSIPDIFPPAYPGIVPPQEVPAIAEALWRLMIFEEHAGLRERFREHFTLEIHRLKLAAAIRRLP